MKLNRHNYEEYFILYMDNELSSEDRRRVEDFVQENSDLKAELDTLLQSKLVPDTTLYFDNKEALMVNNRSSINLNNYEQWLLSYVDDELTHEETIELERFVAEHPAIRSELNLLLQTKLQPESIIFPGKESLYRKEEKVRVVSMNWRRIAAAAVLLLGISATVVLLLNNKQEQAVVAKGNKDQKLPGNNMPKSEIPIDETVIHTTPANSDEVKDEDILGPNNSNIVVKQARKETKEQQPRPADQFAQSNNDQRPEGNNLPTPENNPHVKGDTESIVKTNPETDPDLPLTKNKEKQSDIAVTTSPNNAYNTQEQMTPENQITDADVVFASNDGKKNKLRGFFRKVTRTFEKRTNMKATDTDAEDNDRLLIAGLAIKLN